MKVGPWKKSLFNKTKTRKYTDTRLKGQMAALVAEMNGGKWSWAARGFYQGQLWSEHGYAHDEDQAKGMSNTALEVREVDLE